MATTSIAFNVASQARVQGPNGPASAGPPSARLEALETSDDPLESEEAASKWLGLQTSTQYRMHRGLQVSRVRAIQALENIGGDPAWAKQANRMRDCGSSAVVYVREDARPVLSVSRCRHRLCPVCSQQRSWRVGARIEALAKEMDAPKFITLTIATKGLELSEAVEKLRSGWKRLRQTKKWKARVAGGVYCLEVTRGRKGDRWHPHLHVVADAQYFPKGELSAAWESANGDSPIVDIRAVRSRREVAKYVSKYVSKGNHTDKWSVSELAEYAEVMLGQRVTHTFGTLHGKKVDPAWEPGPACEPGRMVSLRRIEQWTRDGWSPANKVWKYARRLGRAWRVVMGLDPKGELSDNAPLVGDEAAVFRAALDSCLLRSNWEHDNPGKQWGEGMGKPDVDMPPDPVFEWDDDPVPRWMT